MLAAVRSALEQAGVEFLISPDGKGSVRPAQSVQVHDGNHRPAVG